MINMDKREILIKQFNNVQRQENKWMDKKDSSFMPEKLKVTLDHLEEKIPPKVKSGLDTAFYKGFQLVFQKGDVFLEKTYNKKKLEVEFDLNNYAIDKYESKRHLKKLDRFSNKSNVLNQSIATLEGGVLGFLGIGLFDIPLFIFVMLKTINEIALSYGYTYASDDEKVYILSLICGTLSTGECKKEYSQRIDAIGRNIDTSTSFDYDLDAVIKETSNFLSTALLTAKVIQGIPILGIIGGAKNPIIISKLGKYAKIKYKKRFLQKKILNAAN